MSVIDIEKAMKHCRALEDDRDLVQTYLDAAEDHAAQYLGRRFFEDQQALDDAVAAGNAGDNPIVINRSIEAACLLILGRLYANREDVVIGVMVSDLPRGSDHLLHPYRIGLGV